MKTLICTENILIKEPQKLNIWVDIPGNHTIGPTGPQKFTRREGAFLTGWDPSGGDNGSVGGGPLSGPLGLRI